MTGAETHTQVDDPGATIIITRLFTEALDARDVDALHVLVSEDVEFRNREGGTLTGRGALQTVVDAARETDLVLVREGPEELRQSDGVQRVTVPVRELVENDDLHRTAVFEVADRSVTAFEVLT